MKRAVLAAFAAALIVSGLAWAQTYVDGVLYGTGLTSGTTTITGGTDTQTCFNDGGTLSCGDAGFVYNKTTDSFTLLGPGWFDAAADAATAVGIGETANCITAEGATADAHETRLCFPDATVGDGLVNIPNVGAAATRTIGLLEAAQTWTATQTFSSALRALNGVVGTPAYSFTNDTDSGVWSRADNFMTVSIGGTGIYEFQTTGFQLGQAVKWGNGNPTAAADDTRVNRGDASGEVWVGSNTTYDNVGALGDSTHRLATVNSTRYDSGSATGETVTTATICQDATCANTCVLVFVGGILDSHTNCN